MQLGPLRACVLGYGHYCCGEVGLAAASVEVCEV